MGFKLKKAWKSATKAVSKGVKSIGGAVWDVSKGIVTGEYLAKGLGGILEFAGNEVLDDVFGLDKIGNEVGNVGSDIRQIGKVLGGEYHDDMKEIQYKQEQLQKKINSYNVGIGELTDKLESLVAFHEIFQMAASNRIDAYSAQYGPELDAAMKELNQAIATLRNEYDFVIGLTEGAFIQRILGSVIMIIGGLASDLGDIVSGKADAATWKRAVTAIVTIVILVIAIATGQLYLIPAILASIAVFMMLDGMYANGSATGAIMSLFDFLFNDVLNLDDLVGKDFDKFDKDHEDYQQMVMYTQIAFSLASAGAQWTMTPASASTATTSSALKGASSGMTQTTNAGASTTGSTFNGAVQSSSTTMTYGSATANAANATTTIFGINTSTYSSIYEAFSTANKVNDILNSKKAYEAMVDKFAEDTAKLENAIMNKYRKNFMKHYKDTAAFLQDQQESIDRYIWSMTASSMYIDPYGTTPVANIRFTPDKDTRVMSFGFEDMFDENSQAGSKGYFNSIIYGS